MKPTNESTKITKEQFDFLFSETITKKEYSEIIKLVNQRVDFIFAKMCHKPAGQCWWDYSSAGRRCARDYGEFDIEQYKEEIFVYGEPTPPKPYDESFPTRWLWEDFEQEFESEVKLAKKLAEEEKEAEKKKRLEEQKRNKEILESIRQKLDKEELKFLGIGRKRK